MKQFAKFNSALNMTFAYAQWGRECRQGMGRSQLALFRNVTSGTSCHSKGNTQQPDLSGVKLPSSCKYSNTYYMQAVGSAMGKVHSEFLVHQGIKPFPRSETNVL